MAGMIEQVLVQRFGPQDVTEPSSGTEDRWNSDQDGLECVLFKPLSWDEGLRKRYAVLEQIYGDVKGGFLLGDSLKVALLAGPQVFGLYSIEELQRQPEVMRANEADPGICFFMDSANVWLYGSKKGELFVYDSDTDELDALGPIETALHQLLNDFQMPPSGNFGTTKWAFFL